MKKQILFLALVMTSLSGVFAQTETQENSKSKNPYEVKTNKFWNNWLSVPEVAFNFSTAVITTKPTAATVSRRPWILQLENGSLQASEYVLFTVDCS